MLIYLIETGVKMAEDNGKAAEDYTLGDLVQLIDGIREEHEDLRRRVDQIEDNTKTRVRVVDTDQGKRIVLENRQQTWFSPNYFRTILERLDEGEDVEGEIWEGEEARE